MIQQFSYDLVTEGDIQTVAEKNKQTEEKINKIVNDALDHYKEEFKEKEITYELRFLQGKAELEIFNLEEDTDLARDVDNSLIAIGTLIGASEH